MRYQGEASFVRCLAHILNLTFKESLDVNHFYIPRYNIHGFHEYEYEYRMSFMDNIRGYNNNSCLRPCSFPLVGSMLVNFYLQGNPLEGKKTYSTASLAKVLCTWPFTFKGMSPLR
jgi:hypothetical protein